MKKIIITLILFMFIPTIVLAKDVGANLQGVTIIRPGTAGYGGGGGDCGDNPFWFSQNAPTEGLRITFYSNKGKQIGTTIDVWNTEFGGSKTLIDNKESIGFKGYALQYDQFGHYYVYKNVKTGEVNYKPTRIDFLDAGLKNDGTNYELVRYYLGYKVYVDEVALKMTCKNFKAKNNNPLTYTEDSAKCMIDYFTTKEEKDGVVNFPVMDRYLQLTGADKYVTTAEGNYVMLLEPIIKIDQCGGSRGRFLSITTASEWGMVNKKECESNKVFNTYCTSDYNNFVSKATIDNGNALAKCMTETEATQHNYYKNVDYPLAFNGYYAAGNRKFICGAGPDGGNGLRQVFSNHLTLGSNQSIGGYKFKGVSSKDPRHIISPVYNLHFMDMLWLDGYGIGAINGTDLCEPNCVKEDRYQIVYRTVDLNNPFLALDGTNRTLSDKSNWYSKESTIDKSIYSKKPLYTITLSPSKIKEIRESNKNVKYSDIIKNNAGVESFAKSKFKKDFGL